MFACFSSFHVQAAIVDDLYSIELDVPDQSTSLRLEAFKKAFDDVVMKVSGSPAPLKSKAFKQARARVNRYVKQFSYQRSEIALDAVDENPLKLNVVFSQKQIESLLRGNGFPVWGQVRPSVLVVMSSQINRNHEFVSGDSAPDIIEEMDKLATKHGLPLQFPLLDLADQAALNIGVSALENINALKPLSSRYQSDVVLFGELVGVSGKGWKGVWQSEFSGQLFQWRSSSPTKEVVMAKAVAHLAKLLAQEYALGSAKENRNSLVIHVANVHSLEQYLRVSRYFSSLAVVEKTKIQKLTTNSVSFELALRNSPEELQRLIELGKVVEQIEMPAINLSGNQSMDKNLSDSVTLTYQLM